MTGKLYFHAEPLYMDYQPGAHLIASLSSTHQDLLLSHKGIAVCIDALIGQHGLQKLGEIYHDFTPGGFTAVICLSESHISVHTWPEHGLINLDIYLSNFQRNNDGTVNAIYKTLQGYFHATVCKEQIIMR